MKCDLEEIDEIIDSKKNKYQVEKIKQKNQHLKERVDSFESENKTFKIFNI